MESPTESEILSFRCANEWTGWLDEHHAESNGLWMRIFKPKSGVGSITYAEAVDSALCYGWIDAQKRPFDENSWLQHFTPRRPASKWSKINTQHAERLIRLGRMHPAGWQQIEAAKRDGRWDAAYDSSSTATVPEDFQAALSANASANQFFIKLDRANRYAILYRLQNTKKADLRQKKISQFVEMLERGEKIHP